MMTEQAINQAIAEACGWRFDDPSANQEMKCVAEMCWIRPNGADWQTERLPQYTTDLNAMHEAVLYADTHATAWNAPDGRNDTFQEAYMYHLAEVCKCGYWSIVHATARQRAEAFLRTVGKWVEE